MEERKQEAKRALAVPDSAAEEGIVARQPALLLAGKRKRIITEKGREALAQIREFWALPAGQSLRQFWQQPWFHNFIVLCRHSVFWEEFLPSLSYIAWRGQAVFRRCVLFCWALQYSLCSGDCLLHLVQQAVEPHRR